MWCASAALLGDYHISSFSFSPFSRSNSLFNEVVQMNFEIASFSSLSGTQPITWQVEYPRKGMTDVALSEIFICQKDLVGIVPLAMVSLVLHPRAELCEGGKQPCRQSWKGATAFFPCLGPLAQITSTFHGGCNLCSSDWVINTQMHK